MNLYLEEFGYENLSTFLHCWNEDLVKSCKRAMEAYGIYDESQYEDFVVLMDIEGYYCIARIINEWTPLEISDEVQPFDKDRVYPAQRIEKRFCFKRW